ncbi:related to SCP160 - involved in control of mitotic chromsome transmission [Melanopsichium pennsylvanicum]|uniref:Related to SCP160 - involved in control of mitotic chromsome transmission n=2 Tax=Melanopsichium pennsylvanicum TaxID=63383 RepID=A0AAJ5C5B0_9BASI|nr:related to SCP160-involved in control of mitotic chromsome transmission [Melanopsichium pennsylvanicum 4]SNX84541.1 related to SCP160 - involved in control of mitotic chromsome transmission [Melanopsichium pennsylvanicum]
MVSAADLMRQHQAQLSQADAAAEHPPMADPFPSLTQDPFPAEPTTAPAPSASASGATIGASNGVSASDVASGATNGRAQASGRAKQPDFSSELAFPSLGAAVNPAKGQWGTKGSTWTGSAPVIQRSVAQQTFSLSLSHESVAKLSTVMSKVQNKYRGVKIEASTTRKTGTTTFVLKAADEAVVKNAKREITVLLAKHVSTHTMIPASLRAFVIGTKGKNLKSITEQTGVKVNIPKSDPAADLPAEADASQRNTIDYENDEQIAVTLEGDEINVKQAQAMIQAIVAERTSKITQRLVHIDHIFYPFIAGPKGVNAAKLEKEAGEGEISIRVPPRAAFLHAKDGDNDAAEPKRERDLAIIVSGDREKVQKAVAAIEAQVDEMKNSFRTLAISIPKRQHRFLVGDAANDILASTSCSVELAAIDDPSDSITIRGPQTQLPLALTAAMEKANAVRVEIVDVVAAHRSLAKDPVGHAKHVLRWLNVGGKILRSSTAQIYLPRPAIVESTGNVQIEIVGSDAAEVSKHRETIQELVKSVPPSFVEVIELDPLLHRFIIGKKGQGLKPYEARGVDVLFPPASSGADGDSRSDVLLVLAGASIVAGLPSDRKARDAKAKEILDAVTEDIQKAQVAAADIRTETLAVPAKLHRSILGPNGTTLNAVIGEDRLVAVKLGSSNAAAADKAGSSLSEDSILVRGPSSEVERVVKELKRIAVEAEQDSIINGHVAEFSVDSNHVPHLVGRGGSAVSKLREELGVRIDFGEPSSAEGTDGAKKGRKAASTTKVVLTGRKENVEEAKKRLKTQVERLADETSVTLKIPQEMHGSFIGSGGKYVTRLQDTYAVRINFPNANAQSGVSTPTEAADDKPARAAQKPDEVIIKGGKKGVEGAKAELLELLEYEKEHNNVSTLTVSTKSIARIMGKSGTTIKQIRDESEAQVDVDREDNEMDGTTSIKIRGTKKAIAAARKAIETIASEVDAEVAYTLAIAPEHHGILIGPQGSNIRDLIIKAGGPEDAKASSQYVQFPRRNEKNSSTVTVRGPASLAKAIRDELQKAAEVLASRVVYGVVVAPQAQRMLIGRGGSRQSELQTEYSVRLVFPGWKEYASTGEPINKDGIAGGDDSTIVKIVGAEDRCKALAEEIKSSFASASESIDVPSGVHARIATPQFFRQLRSDFGVSVDTPRGAASASALTSATAAKISTSAAGARIDDDETAEENEFEIEELSSAFGTDVISWTLTGKDEASLQKAVKRIRTSIKEADIASHEGKLWVSPSAVPRIIGRGGSGLMNIQKESGAAVEIPRDAGGLCIIRGSKDAVLHAKELLENVASSNRRD